MLVNIDRSNSIAFLVHPLKIYSFIFHSLLSSKMHKTYEVQRLALLCLYLIESQMFRVKKKSCCNENILLQKYLTIARAD